MTKLLFYLNVTALSEITSESEARVILAELYDTMIGSRWEFNKNWKSDRPLHEWYGINANFKSSTEIISIDLPGNRLHGTFPSSLFRLRSLESLNIAYNSDIRGTIPSEIGMLTNLVQFAATACTLTGTIPSEINELSNLHSLALEYNYLNGTLPVFSGINSSANINLVQNRLSGTIPKTLFSGVATTSDAKIFLELNLSSNRLTGILPKELAHLENLNIDISNNRIHGVSSKLCNKKSWMHGAVARFGCDAILCPHPTYSDFGMEKLSSCITCYTAEYAHFGLTHCPGEISEGRRKQLEEKGGADGSCPAM